MKIYNDIEQGSPEWHAVRCGVVTASCFSDVMAKGQGKSRLTYMYKLAGERITGQSTEFYSNAHMERGNEMEPEVRQLYEMTTGNEVAQVGFIKMNDDIGYSPDGLIDINGNLEIKTKLPHLQIAVLLSGEVPKEHLKQIQGGLWVSDREWCDFVSYWPGMPPFIKRVHRDAKAISEISFEVEQFVEELNEVVNKIKSM